MLDDHERVARVFQVGQDAVDAVHVARVQSHGGLVEHKERVGKVRAQRRREVDALHFAARQGAALAPERQIAHPDVGKVRQPCGDFLGHHAFGLIEGACEERIEKALDVRHGQGRQIGQRQTGQRVELFSGGLAQSARGKALVDSLFGRQSGLRVLNRAQAPEHAFVVQARAQAVRAQRVAAVGGQLHAHVHLVALGFEHVEVGLDAVPAGAPVFAVVVLVAVDHPVLLRLGHRVPGRIEGNVALVGPQQQIALALAP